MSEPLGTGKLAAEAVTRRRAFVRYLRERQLPQIRVILGRLPTHSCSRLLLPTSTWWLVSGIAVIAAGLRLYHIGTKALWVDEAFSQWVAGHPLHEIWHLLARIDDQPPLYYALLHFWLFFGDREGTLRALSALSGALTVPFAYLLGWSVGGTRLGVLTAFLLAISPFNVEYGQDARMYPLLTLAATMSMAGLAWLLRWPQAASIPLRPSWLSAAAKSRDVHATPERITGTATGAWAAYTLGIAATLWSQYIAVLLLLSTNLIVLASKSSRNLGKDFFRNWTIAQAAVLFLCAPLFPLLAYQLLHGAINQTGWIPASHPRAMLGVFRQLLAGAAFVNHQAPWIYAVEFAVIGVGIWGWLQERHWIIFTTALVLVPIVSELIVSIRHPIFISRTLIWTTVPLCLMVAAGLVRLRGRVALNVGIAVLLFIDLNGVWNQYWSPEPEPWDHAATYVAQNVRPGDAILFDIPFSQPAFDYYFRRYGPSVVEDGLLSNHEAWQHELSQLRLFVATSRRIWLISYQWPPGRSVLSSTREHLAEWGHLVHRTIFVGRRVDIPVYLYEIDLTQIRRLQGLLRSGQGVILGDTLFWGEIAEHLRGVSQAMDTSKYTFVMCARTPAFSATC